MFDYHVHSTFSDGRNTPDEIIREAISRGFSKIGFSDHSRVSFDPFCGVDFDKYKEYKNAIDKLKEKYAGSITVYCGLEQDYFSPAPEGDPDYLIGSVHYVCKNGHYFGVDNKAEIVTDAIRDLFDGDAYAYAEAYFALMEDLIPRTNADIIGHFDLLTRFENEICLFDPKNPRYVKAWQKAVNALLPYNKPFEINTGGISRGFKTDAYPSQEIRQYIADHGGKFILSSDSHRKDTIGCHFEEYEEMYHDCLFDPLC